jgi:hypothetical protein
MIGRMCKRTYPYVSIRRVRMRGTEGRDEVARVGQRVCVWHGSDGVENTRVARQVRPR